MMLKCRMNKVKFEYVSIVHTYKCSKSNLNWYECITVVHSLTVPQGDNKDHVL